MIVVFLLHVQCVELDKFEPFDNEEKLVEQSLDYIEDYLLWAGKIHFLAFHPRIS